MSTILENTKYGVTELLKRMVQMSDKFVDKIAEIKPEEFKNEPGKETALIDPFLIVGLIVTDLAYQFESFKKENGLDNKVPLPENVKEGNVVQFGTVKKKNETAH